MLTRKWVVRGGLIVLLAGLAGYQYYAKSLPLAPLLVSSDDDTRNMALSRLTTLSAKSKSQTAEALVQYKSDPDPKTRRYALYSLRQLGLATPEALSFSVKSLADADASVREEAMAALLRFGEDSFPALINIFRNDDGPLVEIVIKIFKRFEAKGVPALTAFLKENPPKGQLPAVRALREIGKPAKEATPILLGLLDSPDLSLRIESAEALSEMGLLNASAAPKFARDLPNAKESYSDPLAPRPRLAALLEKLDSRKRELIDLGFDLKQKDPVIRYRAAYVISEMNPASIGTMEMLVEALNDSDVFVSARAVVGLTHLGFDKTERIKQRSIPRLKAAIARAQAANIEGFDAIVNPVVSKSPYFKS